MFYLFAALPYRLKEILWRFNLPWRHVLLCTHVRALPQLLTRKMITPTYFICDSYVLTSFVTLYSACSLLCWLNYFLDSPNVNFAKVCRTTRRTLEMEHLLCSLVFVPAFNLFRFLPYFFFFPFVIGISFLSYTFSKRHITWRNLFTQNWILGETDNFPFIPCLFLSVSAY